MTINFKKYTRRNLLSRIGGTAAYSALLPFIPTTEADAKDLGGAPLRFLYWYMPILPKDNVVATWLPKSGNNLEWTGAMSGLNEMKNKMSCIRGLTNTAAYDSPLSGGHKASGMTMMSGWSAQKGVSNQFDHLWKGANGFNGHWSLDQYLAKELVNKGIRTPRSDIRMGWRNRGHTNDPVWKSVSFKDGVVLNRHQYPDEMYKDIFNTGGVSASNSGNGDTLSVLNHTLQEVKKLKSRLGKSDALRLESHLDSISEVERQLASVNTQKGDCNIETDLSERVDRWDYIINNYSRLIQIAFNCDITRVAGAQWMSHLWGGGITDFLGYKLNYHGTTHNAGNLEYLKTVQEYRAKVFIDIMKSFDSITEANGKTMLDNTILYWYTEVSRNHNWYDQCNIIAGGGNYFKMGVNHVEGGNHGRDNNRPQTKLLASILEAFNIDQGNFISPKYDKGTLGNAVKA